MESSFRSLKAERMYLTRYTSYRKAKNDLFDYPLLQSPSQSLHAGYLNPMEFERRNATSSSQPPVHQLRDRSASSACWRNMNWQLASSA